MRRHRRDRIVDVASPSYHDGVKYVPSNILSPESDVGGRQPSQTLSHEHQFDPIPYLPSHFLDELDADVDVAGPRVQYETFPVRPAVTREVEAVDDDVGAGGEKVLGEESGVALVEVVTEAVEINQGDAGVRLVAALH